MLLMFTVKSSKSIGSYRGPVVLLVYTVKSSKSIGSDRGPVVLLVYTGGPGGSMS